MNREQKAAVIDQIADELGSAGAIIALDYRGITVAQIAELREKLRASDTKLRVAKNSLSSVRPTRPASPTSSRCSWARRRSRWSGATLPRQPRS